MTKISIDVKVRQQREKVEQLVKEGEALILGETLVVNIVNQLHHPCQGGEDGDVRVKVERAREQLAAIQVHFYFNLAAERERLRIKVNDVECTFVVVVWIFLLKAVNIGQGSSLNIEDSCLRQYYKGYITIF